MGVPERQEINVTYPKETSPEIPQAPQSESLSSSSSTEVTDSSNSDHARSTNVLSSELSDAEQSVSRVPQKESLAGANSSSSGEDQVCHKPVRVYLNSNYLFKGSASKT